MCLHSVSPCKNHSHSCFISNHVLPIPFQKFHQLCDQLIFPGQFLGTLTHCRFRHKATNGTEPCYCQFTIHLGLWGLSCLLVSWSIGGQLSLAKLLNLGGRTGAFSCIIQKHGLKFNPVSIVPGINLITPSFRITLLVYPYLRYCADCTLLDHMTIIHLPVIPFSWTGGRFKADTHCTTIPTQQCTHLYFFTSNSSTSSSNVCWMNKRILDWLVFSTTINISLQHYIRYKYELPNYLVTAIGKFSIGSPLISISLA